MKKFGTFSAIFGNSADIRPRNFSATEIFLGPLLRFAAAILAGWQHWI
jgi:hypothetical protein